jgi:hypothetical protein
MAAEVYTVNINTSPAVKSVASLEKELQECTEQLKGVAVGSDAFNALQKQAANCKSQLDQFNRTTDMLSKGFQGWGENAAKMTSGITGGITAATAAMQMMGVENDNVMEGIARLQQLMAFSQGISSLKDLSEGFKNMKAAVKVATGSLHGLKGAIVATGIGALVVALGLLISNWDKVTEAVDGFIGKAGEASKVTATLDGFFAGLKQSVVAVGNAIVQSVTTPFKTIIAAIKAYNDEEGNFFEKIKAAAGAGKAAIVDAGKSTVEGFNEVGTAAATAYNNSIDEQNKAAEDKRMEDAKKAAEERAKAAAEAYNNAHQAAQAALQLANAQAEVDLYGDDKALLQAKINNLKTFMAALKEGTTEWYNTKKQLMDMERELLGGGESSEGGDTSAAAASDPEVEKFRQSLLTQEELYAQSLQNRRDQLNQWYTEGLIEEQEYSAGMQAIDDEQTEHEAENVERIKKANLEKAQQNINNAATMASSVSDILSSLADAQDTTTREGFEKSKKLQIAAATINMLTGIATAMSGLFTTKTGPWDIALAAAQAASIAVAGGVQIAKIKATTFDSQSSTSSLSGTAASSTLVAPTQYSTAVEGANIESAVSDSRVYVVESDIANTSKRVSVQENENRY